MPSNDIIDAAALANPHGFGFASPSVQYKGMSLKKFKKMLKQVPTSEPCIMHFRFATHGSVRQANCHPFKRGDVWFMHNGILDIEPIADMTDSETAFQEILWPAICRYGIESNIFKAIAEDIIHGSRFAFLQGDKLVTLGTYFKYNNDGCLYSNLRFTSYINYCNVMQPYRHNYRGYMNA